MWIIRRGTGSTCTPCTRLECVIACDNFSPHLTTKKCRCVAERAEADSVGFAYTPTNSSWLDRIEAQFTALRYFAPDGIDPDRHREQGAMIRRYIIWRTKRPSVAGYAKSSTGST